jgi:four helix bundle protein
MEKRAQQQTKKTDFHAALRHTLDEFVHGVYVASRTFPGDEQFGVTSQLRRAALSVALNYVEGYARSHERVYRNFLEIAYGSLQETKYLLRFATQEQYLTKVDYDRLAPIGDKLGAMLWGILKKLPTEKATA